MQRNKKDATQRKKAGEALGMPAKRLPLFPIANLQTAKRE